MKSVLLTAICIIAICLTLNTLALFYAEDDSTSLPRSESTSSLDTDVYHPLCDCLCLQGHTKQGSNVSSKTPTNPAHSSSHLDELKWDKAAPVNVFKYQSREEARRIADERFRLLDDFVLPNENLCKASSEKDFEMSPCVHANGTTAENWNGTDGSGLVLMWIHSAPDHFERRRLAREIWASGSLYQHLGVNVLPVFAIGISENLSTHASVLDESSQYGDMVILNYTDVYHNISYKAVGGMRWISKYCPQARTYLKIDDDTLVIPHRFARWIGESRVCHDTLTMRALYIFKRLRKSRSGKWRISTKEWPPRYFAKLSAPGLAYFISVDLLEYIHEAIRMLPWVWLEDVWITGSIAEMLASAGLPIQRENTEPITVHSYSSIRKKLFKQFATKDSCFIGQMPMNRTVYASVLRAASL